MRPSGDGHGAGLFVFVLGVKTAEATLSFIEFLNRLDNILAAEVGPEGIGDIKLGIRTLPDKEVRDAEVTARADD